MAIHTYRHTKEGWKALKTITTEAKARKSKGAVPSVTTVLDILKDGFFHGVWVPQQAAKLARELQEDADDPYNVIPDFKYTLEDIPKALYGFRECPETGEQIPSSDFGTRAHECMEAWATEGSYGECLYGEVCADAVKQLNALGAIPIHAEYICGSEVDESAGTIDLVAEIEREVYLADHKFRSCKGGRAKFYNKDLDQLAIEAEWYCAEKNLEKIPKIMSICVDADTGKANLKVWSEEQQREGAHRWRCCRALYKAVHKF